MTSVEPGASATSAATSSMNAQTQLRALDVGSNLDRDEQLSSRRY
jgi:hypothetical protein